MSSIGVLLSASDYAPFGQTFQGGTQDPYQFTGKERDTESGLDYFGARYYGSNMGRFISPDPSGLLYTDSGNPQSLNLYSYVLNNPQKFTDPAGMYCDYSDHNDPQSGFDPSQFDYNSNSRECGKNGGQWDDDAYTHNGADDANRPQYAVSSITNAPNGPWTFDDFNAMYQAWNQGLLPQQLNYGQNSWETIDMSWNYFVRRARNAYIQAGCPASFPMAAGHYEAAFASWGNASTDVLMGNNPDFLALQVGGWSGSIQTSGDVSSFTINNPMTQSSFGGESAAQDTHTTDNPNGPDGPRHNVMQTFAWSERGLCHH
jgi:RHS repeat-associated protein